MQLALKLQDRKTACALAFLAVQSFFLLVLFVLYHQTEVEMDRQITANTIITKSSTISKSFYDAAIALAIYGVSRNQLLNDRYQSIVQQIPLEVSELRNALSNNENEQQASANINDITTSGLEILKEAKTEADTSHLDMSQDNSRQTLREIRLLADRLNTELSHIAEGARKAGQKSGETNQKYKLAINIFFALAGLLNVSMAIAIARCQR
jgi:hypothetical protein